MTIEQLVFGFVSAAMLAVFITPWIVNGVKRVVGKRADIVKRKAGDPITPPNVWM